MSGESKDTRDLSALQALGARIGHDASVYGLASAGTLVIGVLSLAVYTRFLPPSEYGRLAAMLFLAALLTVVYNLGWVQGMSRALFKGADPDEDPVELDPAAPHVPSASRAEVLLTALAGTALAAVLGTAVVVGMAPQLAELLADDERLAGAVRWTAAIGASAALWRLAANILRLEGHPALWAVVNLARPLLAAAVSIPLLATSGAEVTDVLAGFAAGNLVSLAMTITVVRIGPLPAPTLEGAGHLMRLGAPLIPIALAMWILQNADIFMMSQLASSADLGLYRAASRIGAVAAYATSAFFLAFGPVRRGETHAEALREHGKDRTASVLTTAFVVVGMMLLLVLALGADLFVRIIAPEYSDAAPLIPLTAAGALAIGWFRLTYALTDFPRKRRAFAVLIVVAALAFFPLSAFAIQEWEGHGAALAVAVVPMLGVAGMAVAARTAGARLLHDARPVAITLMLGFACMAAGLALGRVGGTAGPALEGAALLVFPALVVATGTVPRAELPGLWRVVRAATRR